MRNSLPVPSSDHRSIPVPFLCCISMERLRTVDILAWQWLFHCVCFFYVFLPICTTTKCVSKCNRQRMLLYITLCNIILSVAGPLLLVQQWGAEDAEIKVPSARTQSLNVLLLEPGVGQYIAIHATLTARNFFLAYFYPSGPFTCIFFQNLSRFFLCWLWLTHGSCVGPQNKIGHPARGRFPCRMPAEYK